MTGLGSLIAPLPYREFFETHFTKTCAALQPTAAVEELTAILGNLDLRSLLKLPRRPEINLSNEDSTTWFTTFDPDEALAAFKDGYTAYFHIGQMMPSLRGHLTAIAAACATPTDNVDISLFVSPPASKTPLHFDSSQNFTLQLSGLKQWHIAKNNHVAAPTENWMPGRPVSSQWQRNDGPQDLGDVDAELVLLDQGSGLYIPGGTWHAVEALTECVSLTYAIDVPRYSDVLAEEIRRQSNLHEQLRGSLLRGVEFSPIASPGIHSIDIAPEQFGLHPDVWNALKEPDRVTREVLRHTLSEAQPSGGLNEHACVTLFAARPHFDFTDDATEELNRWLDQEPTSAS